MVLLLGCSSSSAVEEDVSWGETGHISIDDSDSSVDDRETDKYKGDPEESSHDESVSGHWWGQIQERADHAYEEMEDQIARCLERLGDASEVREIALKARAGEAADVGYELVDVAVHPPQEIDEPCVRELSNDFIEAVDYAFWDDFDTYIATFIHRGELIDSCSEEAGGNAVCVELQTSQRATLDGDKAHGECDDELVDAINAAMRGGRDCWSPSRFRDRATEFEEAPLHLRAVLFGHLYVESGIAKVVLRYNQPWVEEMASCVVDAIADADLEAEVTDPSCQSTLSNRSLTYWFRPVFTYIYDEDVDDAGQ